MPRTIAKAATALLALACLFSARTGSAGPRPGDLLRVEQISGAPAGSTAQRIFYRSTGLKGEPIVVSGIVVIPPGAPPPGGREIVAWAHPTTGVVPRCAPSLRPGVFATIPGISEMLQRGFIVAATDYPGLGTEGPHPYLVGLSEGRAVIDSVRAARALAGADAGRRFAVWGHSQGGHAALYTGELARDYAPELRLVGIAAAAPATELAALFDKDISTLNGKILTAMTLWSWSKVFGAPLDKVVDQNAMASIEDIAGDCVESIWDVLRLRFAERPLERTFLKVEDLAKVEPWRTLMSRNTPRRTPKGMPVFLAQGTADVVVSPQITAAFKDHLCGRGVPVEFLSMPHVIHALAAHQSAAAAVAWISDRFAGVPAPSDCTPR